jgi:GcrA cell cycle regulator
MALSEARLANLYEQRRSPNTWKNAATANWTDERCQQLTELWATGATCREIARQMGGDLTRNAIIGKARRLKLPPRVVYHPKTNKRYIKGREPKKAKAKKSIKFGAFQPGIGLPTLPEPIPGDMKPLKGTAWQALPGSHPKPLLAIAADGGCRWPIGEDRPYHFCGEPIAKGVYCAAHRAIAFVPVNKVRPRVPVGKFKDIRILEDEAI